MPNLKRLLIGQKTTHNLLQQKERETERDRNSQKQSETVRNSQRQTETDSDRQRQTHRPTLNRTLYRGAFKLCQVKTLVYTFIIF